VFEDLVLHQGAHHARLVEAVVTPDDGHQRAPFAPFTPFTPAISFLSVPATFGCRALCGISLLSAVKISSTILRIVAASCGSPMKRKSCVSSVSVSVLLLGSDSST